MPNPEQEIEFLKWFLGCLQLEHEAYLYRVTPEGMYREDNIPDSEVGPVFEKAARLASKYGLDDTDQRQLFLPSGDN